MICFAEPVLTEDLCVVQEKEFSMLYVRYINLARPSMFIRDKPTLSLEGMLRKDYDRKGSLKKSKSVRDPQGACRRNELIGGEPPVVK
jgi:hypothetical protein